MAQYGSNYTSYQGGYQPPQYSQYGNQYANNLMQSAQQRLQQMEQYPQFQQQMQQMQQPQIQGPQAPTVQQSMESLQVTSIDEAKAYQISFDGRRYVFYNTSNGDIYVKQFDINTGLAPLRVYKTTDNGGEGLEIKDSPPAPIINDQPKINDTLMAKVDELRADFQEFKEAVKNGIQSASTCKCHGADKSTSCAANADGEAVSKPKRSSRKSDSAEPQQSDVSGSEG